MWKCSTAPGLFWRFTFSVTSSYFRISRRASVAEQRRYGRLTPAQTRLACPGKTGGMSWGSLASLESVSPAIPLLYTPRGMPCQKRCPWTYSLLQLFSRHPPTHSTQAMSLLSVSRCSPNLRRRQQQRQLSFPMVPPMFGPVYLKLGWSWAIQLISRGTPVYGNAR